jgi:hypothetical protein
MNRFVGKISGLVLALILLSAVPSFGWVPWVAAARAAKTLQYDRGTVQTLSGTVIDVQNVISKVHLLLRVGRATIVVQLGPASWLARHNFSLAPGRQVTVTGSRINRLRRSFLIAREIKKSNQVLLLRDENGRPLWTLARNLR